MEKVKEVQNEMTKKMWEDTIANAPVQTGAYISSIQVQEVIEQDGIYTSAVYSDLYPDDPKWKSVPFAAFMEWGTGPLGESSNDYEHGYSYTTNAPWNWQTEIQYITTGTWGMRARPHFYPALQKTIPEFNKAIRKAMRK